MIHNHHHNNQGKINVENDNTTFCPVMKDMAVNKNEAEKEGLVREYKGKKYYFCCSGCLTDFDADPELYTK